VPINSDRNATLRALRKICRQPTGSGVADDQRISTGIPALDALLPGGGLERGSLVEWMSSTDGSGAAVLAMQNVRTSLINRSVWAVVDPNGEFHPPAAAGWGASLKSLLLLRPASAADSFWTVEQCLRCPAVGLTWFQIFEPLPERVVHRWTIAAEAGRGIGLLFGSARTATQASWSDVRWQVQSRPGPDAHSRRTKVELMRCRGVFSGGTVDLDIDDATGYVRLVSDLAGSAAAIRSVGA
jgi:protein ImuA